LQTYPAESGKGGNGAKEENMKKGIVITLIVLAGLVLSVDSDAQKGMKWQGSGGWGAGAQYDRMYDVRTVESLSGEVVSVDRMVPMKGMSYGLHVTVRTAKETISVHLGPGWYIENQDVMIGPKDMLGIKGSRVTLEGKPVIIAAEVKKGDQVMKLRDEQGFPVWAGWRKR